MRSKSTCGNQRCESGNNSNVSHPQPIRTFLNPSPGEKLEQEILFRAQTEINILELLHLSTSAGYTEEIHVTMLYLFIR